MFHNNIWVAGYCVSLCLFGNNFTNKNNAVTTKTRQLPARGVTFWLRKGNPERSKSRARDIWFVLWISPPTPPPAFAPPILSLAFIVVNPLHTGSNWVMRMGGGGLEWGKAGSLSQLLLLLCHQLVPHC